MGNQVTVLEDDDIESLDNVKFYTNKLSAKPSRLKIDNIHQKWFGDWEHLEDSHSYIQWLFPIREGGMNFRAQPMSKHESSIFRKTKKMQERLIESYKLMLDFYGLILVNSDTGLICKNPKTHFYRYAHLNSSFHNYLRITRILKCLGICGFEHFKKPFLTHFIIEVYKYGNLTNTEESLIRYWIPTLRSKKQILELDNLIKKLGGKKPNRNGRDGWGDEQGENWQTENYPLFKLDDNKKIIEKNNEKNIILYSQFLKNQIDQEKKQEQNDKNEDEKKEENEKKIETETETETKSKSDKNEDKNDDIDIYIFKNDPYHKIHEEQNSIEIDKTNYENSLKWRSRYYSNDSDDDDDDNNNFKLTSRWSDDDDDDDDEEERRKARRKFFGYGDLDSDYDKTKNDSDDDENEDEDEDDEDKKMKNKSNDDE